jgi:hypothetical protein
MLQQIRLSDSDRIGLIEVGWVDYECVCVLVGWILI